MYLVPCTLYFTWYHVPSTVHTVLYLVRTCSLVLALRTAHGVKTRPTGTRRLRTLRPPRLTHTRAAPVHPPRPLLHPPPLHQARPRAFPLRAHTGVPAGGVGACGGGVAGVPAPLALVLVQAGVGAKERVVEGGEPRPAPAVEPARHVHALAVGPTSGGVCALVHVVLAVGPGEAGGTGALAGAHAHAAVITTLTTDP